MRERSSVWGCGWFSCTGCNADAWLWLLLVGCAGSFLILFVCFGWSWLWLLVLVVLCWFVLVGNDCAEFVVVFG